MNYEESINKLESIVRDIEDEKLSLDQLTEKVKEANELIKICKDKLHNTEEELKKLIE